MHAHCLRWRNLASNGVGWLTRRYPGLRVITPSMRVLVRSVGQVTDADRVCCSASRRCVAGRDAANPTVASPRWRLAYDRICPSARSLIAVPVVGWGCAGIGRDVDAEYALGWRPIPE